MRHCTVGYYLLIGLLIAAIEVNVVSMKRFKEKEFSDLQSRQSQYENELECPGVCAAKYMSSYCDVVINEGLCKAPLICCVNNATNVNAGGTGPRVSTPTPQPTTKSTTPQPTTKSTSTSQPTTKRTPLQVVDRRPFCPGRCIMPLLSLACFNNAKVTNLFQCPTGSICCAKKSVMNDLQPKLYDVYSEK